MKNTLKKVVAALEERASQEWDKLSLLERDSSAVAGALAGDDYAGIDSQRARWAAWDSAAEIAKGKGITSFETEQRSV